MNNEVYTAQVVGTELGREDHGIMTCFLNLKGDGWGCSFGGYALDECDIEKKKRVGTAEGMECIIRILQTVEVNSWEKLNGQYVRVKFKGQMIEKIGHVIKDKWFSFSDCFE